MQPEYKEYVISRDPASLQEANNHAVALWKRKNPEGVTLKPTTVFAIESDFGLKNSNLSEEEKEICINALKNRKIRDKTLDRMADFPNTAITLDTPTTNQNPKRTGKVRRKQ